MVYKREDGHNYTIPDTEIDKLLDRLDISIAEACELYLCDHDVVADDTVEELTVKAQKNRVTATIHQAKGEKKERKAREKKENPLKKEIIKAIYCGLDRYFALGYEDLCETSTITVTNDEKYIDLILADREFTINLVEHRKKK